MKLPALEIARIDPLLVLPAPGQADATCRRRARAPATAPRATRGPVDLAGDAPVPPAR